ncbi:hypothetical protein RHSIM_Rhsim13G0128300 [Rhododendron simsii]|uniref:Uncharacterized protein n=1 Tax=Rhododendron simsii TaxID=118357 RepID=A0A834FZC3_RHOSS|nr:hypothetical protein RHSIM_Rhsim13G0128300 [Rhododendron simsii]
MVRKTVDLATVAGLALQQQYQAQDLSTAGLPECKEQSEQVPISHLEQQEPPARTETHSLRRRDSDSAAVGEDERATKKGKTNENVEILSEADPANRNEPSKAFLPDFESLLKDMENLPTGKGNNMAELCLFLAKAGQCASKAFGDMEALLETRRSMRVDLQAKRREADQFVDRIEELEAQIAEAETVWQERDRLLLQLKDAGEENDRLKQEKQQMEEELPKKLEDAGDAGYNEAGEYYAEQVQKLVAKAFKEGELKGINNTHTSSFLHGYQVGLDYAEVPKVNHRRELPVVPPLELQEVLPQEDLPNPTTDSQPDLTDADDK